MAFIAGSILVIIATFVATAWAGLSSLQLLGGFALVGAIALGRRLAMTAEPADDHTNAEAGRQALGHEIARARRMERRFTIVSLTAGHNADQNDLLAAVKRSIRELDAAWEDAHSTFILLSETPASGVSSVLVRLSGGQAPAFQWTAVEYPRDGLTLEALMSGLEGESDVAVPHTKTSDRGAA